MRAICVMCCSAALAACGRLAFDPGADATGDGFAITPRSPTMNLSSEVMFSTSGGTPPITFRVASGRGVIDATTGAFFSPTARGTTEILATDAAGQVATTTVTYGGSQIFVLGGLVSSPTTTVRTSSDGVTWTRLMPGLPAPRDSGSAVVYRDAIYYIGGDNGGGTSTVWRSTDGASFEVVGTFPIDVLSSAAVVHDREIWVLGGYNGPDFASSYASSDGTTWVRKTDLPTARHEATAYDRGDLYVIGGHDGTGFLRTVSRLDPTSKTWALVGMTNIAVDFQSGAEAGGLILHGSGVGSVALDRSTDFMTWSPCAPLPMPLAHPAIVDLNGEILVIGQSSVLHSRDCLGWTTTSYPDLVDRTTAVQFTPL